MSRAPIYEGRGRQVRIYDTSKPHHKTDPWRAWDVSLMPRPAGKPDPAWSGDLAQWLIYAPGSHPLWPWHIVSTVHLRPIEGVPPAKLHRPTSSHEFLIMAINPECGDPNVDDVHAWIDEQRKAKRSHYLSPPDLVHQIDGATDEMAAEICRLFVRAMCDGHTSPDVDYLTYNRQMLDATLAHMLEGKHLPS